MEVFGQLMRGVFRPFSMAGYKAHPASGPLLIGYDPYYDLPDDHLARLVDEIVDELVAPAPKEVTAGQPERDPRVLIKVLVYSSLMRVHSSRRMAQYCHENLAYLFLVRDDRPCHTALAQTRRSEAKLLKDLFRRLNRMAQRLGMPYLGRIAIDSSKFAANVSKDSVVAAQDYDQAVETFDRILKLMEETDAQEDAQSAHPSVVTGVPSVQMREVLRMIGKEIDGGLKLTPQMVKRVKASSETVKQAKAEGLSYVSVTDPGARMMMIGVAKKSGMGYTLEAVTDGGNLVVGQTGNNASDGGRLAPLVELARQEDLVPVTQVTADTGYFCGGQIHDLLAAKIGVIVPDQATSRALRFGPSLPQAAVEFTKLENENAYVCTRGNILRFKQPLDRAGGQRFMKYVATEECTGCPLASQCLQQKNAKRRNLMVGEYHDELEAYSAKLREPENRKAYNARGPAVETVFALLRHILGFDRWHVRGRKSVESEGALVCCAYQLKKIQIHLKKQGKTLKEAMA
jgi:transposase